MVRFVSEKKAKSSLLLDLRWFDKAEGIIVSIEEKKQPVEKTLIKANNASRLNK